MTSVTTTRWRGAHIEVLSDGSWSFHTCLRCDGALTGPNQIGYGPECRARKPLDWETERRKALAADRRAYRADRRAGAPI